MYFQVTKTMGTHQDIWVVCCNMVDIGSVMAYQGPSHFSQETHGVDLWDKWNEKKMAMDNEGC